MAIYQAELSTIFIRQGLRPLVIIAALCVLAAVGCQLVAGIGDIELASPDGGGSDATNCPSTGATRCGNQCVDLLTSAQNCGACGRDCLGGSCWAAACQPTVLVPDTTASVVAVDSSNVYWWHRESNAPNNADAGALMKCNKAACASQTSAIVTGREPSPVIAVDDASAYWTEQSNGLVLKCDIASCNDQPTVMATNQQNPMPLVLDSTNVYWANFSYSEVFKCSKTGCTTPTYVGGDFGPVALAVDANNVYWLNTADGKVVACDKNAGCGNTPVVLAVAPPWTFRTGAMAVGSSDLYWLESGDGGPNGVLAKCAVGGCAQQPTELVTGLSTPYAFAFDGTDIYWSDVAGVLRRCATSGCNNQPAVVAAGQGYVSSIAVDAMAIYWTSSQGVMRLAK